MVYLLAEGINVVSVTSMELECMDRYRHSLLRRLWAPTDWHVLSSLHCYCLGDCFNVLLVFSGPQGIELLWKSGILQAAEEVVRAGFFLSLVHQVVKA